MGFSFSKEWVGFAAALRRMVWVGFAAALRKVCSDNVDGVGNGPTAEEIRERERERESGGFSRSTRWVRPQRIRWVATVF